MAFCLANDNSTVQEFKSLVEQEHRDSRLSWREPHFTLHSNSSSTTEKIKICTMASETTNNNSIKRRKTDGSSVTSLSDFPIGILEHAASFLAPPSRALFAVTLTIDHATDPNRPSDRLLSITGSDWGTLDFGEIEKDLARKLSDDDLSSVLQLIDAANNVKRLRLTNCMNITGNGLQPLCGSTIIEQIDLSLVGDGENPRPLDIEHSMSWELVLPTLDSIIELEGCALKYVQFPHRWWRRRTPNYSSSQLTFNVIAIHAFIGRYNQMLENRGTIRCLHCNQNLPQHGRKWIATSSKLYGKNNHTCYQCTKHYCYDCSDEDGIKNFRYCDQCQRDYCKECVEFGRCQDCYDLICENCLRFECNVDECHDKFCSECVEASHCDECNKFYCTECRYDVCKEGSDVCGDCIQSLDSGAIEALVTVLKNEVSELKLEVEDVKQLQKENGELKDVNKELQDEIKVLNDKIKSMAVQGPGI